LRELDTESLLENPSGKKKKLSINEAEYIFSVMRERRYKKISWSFHVLILHYASGERNK